mmetsp:Transcript_14431/g.14393  ORF Transcript_14431/g.14393 Transcript_14431/m.14393 type:complete len:123 (+) Transcript_14431:255-623(+)
MDYEETRQLIKEPSYEKKMSGDPYNQSSSLYISQRLEDLSNFVSKMPKLESDKTIHKGGCSSIVEENENNFSKPSSVSPSDSSLTDSATLLDSYFSRSSPTKMDSLMEKLRTDLKREFSEIL